MIGFWFTTQFFKILRPFSSVSECALRIWLLFPSYRWIYVAVYLCWIMTLPCCGWCSYWHIISLFLGVTIVISLGTLPRVWQLSSELPPLTISSSSFTLNTSWGFDFFAQHSGSPCRLRLLILWWFDFN